MELKHCNFIMACREFFGMLPNQTLQEFVKEVKNLTQEDRAELILLFRTVGYDATKTV